MHEQRRRRAMREMVAQEPQAINAETEQQIRENAKECMEEA
jgi:hypothetical protein